MKFMQKTKEQLENEEQKSSLFNQNYNYLTKRQRYFYEPSFVFFEELKFGRFSYKGANLEIEKLQEELSEKDKSNVNKKKKIEVNDDVEITDEQMAKRYVQFMDRRKAGGAKRKRED